MKVVLQKMIRRRVHDRDGKLAGRIHAVKAEIRGDECVIVEWQLGPAALLARLGITTMRLVGWTRKGGPLRVPWEQLDLSDPDEPRLRCSVDDLS